MPRVFQPGVANVFTLTVMNITNVMWYINLLLMFTNVRIDIVGVSNGVDDQRYVKFLYIIDQRPIFLRFQG